jgi:anti-sigma factor RsiW
MTHQEISEQLSDYVLGLLTPGQADEMAQHLAGCATCRQRVYGEREVGLIVRETLHAATRPDSAQLHQLMPPIPQKKRPGEISANWTVRLAPALVLLVIIVGGLILTAPESKRSMSIFFAATATATSTNTPTATVVQDIRGDNIDTGSITKRFAGDTLPYETEPLIQIVAAPVPLQSPTPVAAISNTTTN